MINNFYLFEQRTRCLLQFSRELNFFSLREFCKDQKEWMSKGAMSVNVADESELPSQAVAVFI